jgi:hypothetical protein
MFFDENEVIGLGATSKEEDLTPTGRIIINGPKDGRCDVCGRHMSELTPFRGPGDPLVGDYRGELLVIRWRHTGPYDEEAEKAWEEARKEVPEMEDELPWFIEKFGEGKGKALFWAGILYGSMVVSYECRDCVVLDFDEYFQKVSQIREDMLSEPNQD